MFDLPFSEEEYYDRLNNEDRCATIPEAIREWAWNVGYLPDHIDSQWLLTDYDSWERNPHYTGPDQGHPEDAVWEGEHEASEARWEAAQLAADPAYQNWVESQECYPDPF
jgi:hypothetical protein